MGVDESTRRNPDADTRQLVARLRRITKNSLQSDRDYANVLVDLGPDAIAVLRPLLQGEVRRQRLARFGNIVLYSGVLVIFALRLMWLKRVNRILDDVLMLLMALGFLTLNLLARRVSSNQLIRNVVTAVSIIRDIRALPLLLDLWPLEFRGPKNEAVQSGLIGTLSNINSEVEISLTEHQWRILYSLLESEDHNLQVATIQGLRWIGDARAIRPVQRIVDGPVESDKDRHLRDVAVQCVSQICTRIERNRLSATLLKPSAADPSHVVLVRPSSSADTESANALLRPAHGAEE